MKWRAMAQFTVDYYYQYSGTESMTVATGVPAPGVTVPWRLLTPEGSDQFPHKKDCQLILQNFGARANGPGVKRKRCDKREKFNQ